jgi:DNA-binding PadR family transcriptional regulator
MNYIAVYMASSENLGEFEQMVLLAVLRLGGEAYGVSIRAEIAQRTERAVAPGALYTTLERLERKGFLKSRVGDPTPERGGRAKRYYTVSSTGLKAIARAERAFRRLLDGLEIPGSANA